MIEMQPTIARNVRRQRWTSVGDGPVRLEIGMIARLTLIRVGRWRLSSSTPPMLAAITTTKTWPCQQDGLVTLRPAPFNPHSVTLAVRGFMQ